MAVTLTQAGRPPRSLSCLPPAQPLRKWPPRNKVAGGQWPLNWAGALVWGRPPAACTDKAPPRKAQPGGQCHAWPTQDRQGWLLLAAAGTSQHLWAMGGGVQPP